MRKAGRRYDTCTSRLQCFFEKLSLLQNSCGWGQREDLLGYMRTAQSRLCNCPGVTTEGPKGTAACEAYSPNCCQKCDENVTSESRGSPEGAQAARAASPPQGMMGHAPPPPRETQAPRLHPVSPCRPCNGASCVCATSSGACNISHSLWPCTCTACRLSGRASASSGRCCSQTAGCSPQTRIWTVSHLKEREKEPGVSGEDKALHRVWVLLYRNGLKDDLGRSIR